MTTATLETPIATGSVICIREELLNSLSLAAQITTQRTPKPILQCVRMVTVDASLAISATKLDTYLSVINRKVQVESAMDVAVHCGKLLAFIQSMDEDTVTLRVTGTLLEVRGNSATFKLPTEDPAQMPPAPDTTTEASVKIPAATFPRLVKQTKFAVADSPQRLALHGLYVNAKAARVEFVGTEGRIICCASTPATPTKPFSVIAQPDALALAERAVGEDGDVTLSAAGNNIVIEAGDVRIVSTQIEGTYPPYEDATPAESTATVKAALNRECFLSCVRQAGLVAAGDVDPVIALDLSSASGVTLSASAGGSNAEVAFPCKVEGAAMVIGLNPKWLIQGLSAATLDEISAAFIAATRPAVFRCGPDFYFCVAQKALRN